MYLEASSTQQQGQGQGPGEQGGEHAGGQGPERAAAGPRPAGWDAGDEGVEGAEEFGVPRGLLARSRAPGRPLLWPALRGGGYGGAAGRRRQPSTLSLYRRPELRGLFVLYLVVVHASLSAVALQQEPLPVGMGAGGAGALSGGLALGYSSAADDDAAAVL